jgi:uncharacterized membrane protein
VPANFWQEIVRDMEIKFRDGNMLQGLVIGITNTGNALKEHFPHQDDDKNELSDEISRS